MTTTGMETANEAMIRTAEHLIAILRHWGKADNPQVGYSGTSAKGYRIAAANYQEEAMTIAAELQGLLDRPDAMEAYLMPHGLRNRTVNMDTIALRISDAVNRATDAAFARRNEREGFRYSRRGFRERRTAEGTWEPY